MKSQILRHLFLLSLALPSLAQISMPTNRIVFQRGNDNTANVPIARRSGATAYVQARATALNGGQSTDWQIIATNVGATFEGTLRLSGGWYLLEVRTASVSVRIVDRVGVGEVFVKTWQSDSYDNNWDCDKTVF